MLGRKTLGEIREELRRAFAADGGDPISRLDELMKEEPAKDKEVLESLKRLLQASPRKIQKRRAATKK
jgi:hypothetical protein